MAGTGEETNRRSERSSVLLQAVLETGEESLTVTLRNLSTDGALVKGSKLPYPGRRVLFHRQGLCVPCRVAWVHSAHAGLEFEEPLFPKEVLRHVPPAERTAPPVIQRRPGLAPRPLSAAERSLIEQWASGPAHLPVD